LLSSTRSPGPAAATTAGPGRLRRLLVGALLATLAMTAAAAPARASLAAVGPVNPRTGYPDWYQDGGGLKLQLCTDGLPVCSAAPGDLVPPDGEAFYWRGQGDLTSGTLKAKLALAQEAAFLGNDPVAFGRVRATIVGGAANTTYTIRHPYGTLTITTDGNGIGKSSTDVGCGAAPCDWAAALGSALGPYLHWDPTVPPAPPAGYIGDAATPHKVVGSPTGFNGFSLQGGGLSLSTDVLTVEGKLAGPPVPDIDVAPAADFGTVTPGAPIQRTIAVRNLGVPDASGASNLSFGTIGIGGAQAGAFAIVGNTCSGQTLASGQGCLLTVQLNPAAPGAYSAVLGIGSNAAHNPAAVALSATVAAPSAGVAGVTSSRLGVRGLSTTHRLSRARVLRRGLRLTMVLPPGTQIIKIAVRRVRHGKVVRKPIWTGFRVAPSRPGLYHLTLDSRALRRRLTPGLYQVNVTPGASRSQLGRTSTTRVRVTRG
jgi:hypothetical protein